MNEFNYIYGLKDMTFQKMPKKGMWWPHTLIFNKRLMLISAPPTGNGPRLPVCGQNLWFHPDTQSEVLEDVRATGDRTRGVRAVFSSVKGVQAERRETEVLTVPESRQGRDSLGQPGQD